MTAREECTCGKIPYQWARLVDPECKAVHHDETHGYHTADGDEVLGRYYERVGPAFVEEPVVERIRCREGYGYCPFCMESVEGDTDWHSLEDLENAHIRITPGERDSLIAEIERLKESLAFWHSAAHAHRLKGFELEGEITKLREFFEAVFRDVWDLHDPDGGDLQDTAERLGLIVRVPADEQFRDEYDADEMFVWVWHPLAAEALKHHP